MIRSYDTTNTSLVMEMLSFWSVGLDHDDGAYGVHTQISLVKLYTG